MQKNKKELDNEKSLQLYSVREAANLLRVPESTVRRLEKIGQLKSARLGGRIMFSAEMLQNLIRDASERV